MNDPDHQPTEWQYYWDENYYVQVYMRRRFEPTVDRMPKPRSQILAYVQHVENCKYRALLHNDEIDEMWINHDLLENIKIKVESYFTRNAIDE